MIDTHLFFDIETLPTIDEATIADIASGITAPGNYRKPESIQKWVDEEKPAAVAEAVARTSFDGGYGRVASIAWVMGDEPVTSADSRSIEGVDDEARAERAAINFFFADAEGMAARLGTAPTIVGHNVQFDIRFLWKRALILGILPPAWWPVDAKPWDRDRVFCTMSAWEGHGNRISQDRLARIFGLAGKGDFDGSMVAAAWSSGEYDRVTSYNRDDVECVRSIWRRLTGTPTPAALPVVEAPGLADIEEVVVSAQSLDVPVSTRPAVGFRPGGFRPGAVRP